jgi:translocation and assembly module TamA
MRPPRADLPPFAWTRLGATWLALALAGCASMHGTPDRPVVTSVDIEGLHGVSSGEFEEKLATQPSQGFLWSFTAPRTRYLDRDALANDRKRIERALQAQGYYSARVAKAEVRPESQERAAVVFHLVQGEPTRVASLRITGMEGAPEASAVPARLPLREGEVFTESAYDETRSRLLAALQESGYAQAEVKAHAEVDPAALTASVTYEVQPGRRYVFGDLSVTGAAAVPPERVRDQAELEIHPGATFDPRRLVSAQSRVFDLGVFGGVRVSPGQPDEAKKAIPVQVAVWEAPFRTVRAGVGLEIQATNRFDAQLLAGWTHRNFLGGLRRLSLDARAGYAWLPTPINPAKQGAVGLFAADFTQPNVIGREVDLNVRSQLERGIEQAYSFTSERLRFGLPIRLGGRWTLGPSYALELYQLTNPPALSPGATDAPQLLQSCPGTTCVLSYLEQRVAWDGRDDPINTHRGLYVSLSLQEAFRLFDSAFRYLRFLPEVHGFIPLGRSTVLALRLQLGLLRPLPGGTDETEVQATPIVARFTAGGPDSMRGYNIRQLSPVARATDASGGLLYWAPLGGDGLVEATAEVRVGLSQTVGLAAFIDAGNVTLRYQDVLDLSRLQWAAGLGVRYRTPFGPIRLDVAGRLPFTFGGGWGNPSVPIYTVSNGRYVRPPPDQQQDHWDPLVAVHISLGEAF